MQILPIFFFLYQTRPDTKYPLGPGPLRERLNLNALSTLHTAKIKTALKSNIKMSNHIFAFKQSDNVEVIDGTYRKLPLVYTTFKKDVLSCGMFMRVQFDMLRVGSLALQKVLGYVEHIRIAKYNIRLIKALSVEAKATIDTYCDCISPVSIINRLL